MKGIGLYFEFLRFNQLLFVLQAMQLDVSSQLREFVFVFLDFRLRTNPLVLHAVDFFAAVLVSTVQLIV